MHVSVLDGSTTIGTANFDHLDPPMGVAWGVFTPSAQYSRDKHAGCIEGNYVEGFDRELVVHAEGYGLIERVRIVVEDSTQLFGEVHLSAYFADGRDYEAFFSEHDDFKAYWKPD